jgi:predicted dienelactone hydrolase
MIDTVCKRRHRASLSRLTILLFAGLSVVGSVSAQQNRIDIVTPLAPEFASRGKFAVGVRTLQLADRNRPDILNTKEGSPTARYDRVLTVEVWYPATLAADQKSGGEYRVITRDPAITAALYGQAVRGAAPDASSGAFPLVILSHGYPGNRFLLSHLGENLASKGFVVVSIDHKDSTYDDQKSFSSTLYNRPFDQLFVLSEMARLSDASSKSFLSGILDAGRTGLLGYSMGGYGVVNVIGGGFSKASEGMPIAPPNRLLSERGAENPDYRKTIDQRIKAAVAIAPWGMTTGFWDAEALKGIRTPVLFVAGSADQVAGYEQGTRKIFLAATNADRYLLTFVNAGHNAAAPIPAPLETYLSPAPPGSAPFNHYADPVWDTIRMNNILQHFVTVFFGFYLRDEQDKRTYLDLAPNGKDAIYSVDREGKPTANHTYWKGFKRGTAVGLILEHAAPGGL